MSVILLDSIFVNSDEEYYPQKEKEKKMNAINEELELSESNDESDKFDEYQHIYDGLH